MPKQVFISHAQEDSRLALDIASHLEAAGHTAWYFERDGVQPVSHLKQSFDAITGSFAVLVAVSRHSILSREVDVEISQSHTCAKPIIPVLVGLTYQDLQRLKPTWAMILGTTVCIPLPPEGVSTIIQRILRGLEILGIPHAALPAPPPEPPVKVPRIVEVEHRMQATPLFGREVEIRKALKMLRHHSLAVTGIKGIGKSKLVSALFERLAENKAAGYEKLYWRRFTYGQPPSFSDFGRRLIKDLTSEEVDLQQCEPSEQVHMVLQALTKAACVLVIDQFEAVLDRETRAPRDPGFADLLTFANQGLKKSRLIVTAWEVPVDSAGVQLPCLMLTGIDDPASRKLIRSKFAEGRLPAGLEELIPRVIEVSRGHPFLLELIARNYSPRDIRELLATDQEEGMRTLAPLTESVASKVVLRLPPRLRDLLTVVCIFSKPCTKDGIAAVAGIAKAQLFKDLGELHHRSLVSTLGEGAYDAHALVREHVLGILSCDEAIRLNRTAAQYYLTLPSPAPEKRVSIADVDMHLDALEHYLRAGMQKEAAELLLRAGLAEEMFRWGHCSELARLCMRFDVKALEACTPSRILGWLGLAHRDLGQYEQARTRYEEALTQARKCGDPALECLQLVNLGDVHFYLGDYARAIDYHNQAAAFLNAQVHDRDLEARNCGCLANALDATGDRADAEKLWERAASICRETGNFRFLGIWTGNLASLYSRRGNWDKAMSYYETALTLARDIGDRRHESWWLGLLGDRFAQQRDTEKARQALTEALSISEKIGFRRGTSRQIASLIDLAARENQPEKAADLMRRALKDPLEAGNLSLMWKCRILINEVCLAEAQRCLAEGRAEEAIERCHEAVEYLPDFTACYKLLGQAYKALGRKHNDRAALKRGVESYTRAIVKAPDNYSYGGRAACHVYLGNLEEAINDYTEAIRLDPGDKGSILSKMEVEICLERYAAARETYGALDGLTLLPGEMVIAACFMSLALALDGMPWTEHLRTLQDESIAVPRDLYDPTDIAPYLGKLSDRQVPAERTADARRIYEMFLAHYGPK